jgi:carbonic anhydrase/acetyltransferase-like protein (isoleucine patch superfamily)
MSAELLRSFRCLFAFESRIMNEDAASIWSTTQAVPSPPSLPYPDEYSPWDHLHSRPVIDPTVWVSPGAVVVGRVILKRNSSVWYGCVLRGDQEFIEVGEETNVQDGSILHVDPGYPCKLGSRVTLGHRALVHASVVGNGALIAIGATVLSRCHIGEGAIIAAGAVVMEGTEVPANTLWAGCPARQIKELNEQQRERLAHTYRHYVNNGAAYLARFGRAHLDALK